MRDARTTSSAAGKYVPKRPTRPGSEIVRLGKDIYKRNIREKVEPEHIGEYVAIDVDSGCWALGSSTMDARDKLDEMRPEAIDVLMERIGYEAVGSIGGGAPRRTAALVIQSDEKTQTQTRKEESMTDAKTAKGAMDTYMPRRPRRHRKETARLGKEIYKRDVRQKVEPEHIGRIVAIDVDSGCWALGDSMTEAVELLRDQRPEAVDVFCERAGYVAVGSIGGGAPRRTNWSKE